MEETPHQIAGLDAEPPPPRYRFTGDMPPVKFALMLTLGLTLLIGGCAGCYLIASNGIDRLKQAVTLDVRIVNDLHRAVYIQDCVSYCQPGDSLNARILLAPQQTHTARHEFRLAPHYFAISDSHGKRIGCVGTDRLLTGDTYTAVVSSMGTCATSAPRSSSDYSVTVDSGSP